MRIQLDEIKFNTALANRLEDREKGEQYYRSILTDVTPEKIVGTEKNKYIRENYPLEPRDYFFTEFDNVEIGARVAFGEKEYVIVEGLRINYCEFKSCHIRNIRFINCSFAGCKFAKTFIERAVFESCYFSIPFTEDGHMNQDDSRNAGIVFSDCNIMADFRKCDLDYSYFERTRIMLSKFSMCSMKQSYLTSCSISGMTLKDCQLQGAITYNADVMEIVLSDECGSVVNEETYFDPYVHTSKPKPGEIIRTGANTLVENYAEMLAEKAKSLRAISNLFEQNDYSNLAGEYYYHSKCVEHNALQGKQRILSSLIWGLCGYGERPMNTLVCIGASIVLWALVYLLAGFEIDHEVLCLSELIASNSPITEIIKAFGHSLFFSITTFSTVGYGNYVPAGAFSLIASGVQMLVGVSLTALWTGCIFRKITR